MSRTPLRLTRDVHRQTAFALVLAFAGLFVARQALAPHPHFQPLVLPAGSEIPPEAPAPDGRLAQEPGVDVTPTGSLGSAAIAPSPTPELTLTRPTAPSRLDAAELARFTASAVQYRKGALADGDAASVGVKDPIERAALDWIALKNGATPDRLQAFASAHPDWPALSWIREARESWFFNGRPTPAEVDANFAKHPPETSLGVIAAARAAMVDGRRQQATDDIRALWRDRDLDPRAETVVLKEFGVLLTRADHKYRADRLLYAEKAAQALRAAALAGPDVVALALARLEGARGPLSARAIASVPANLQKDPGLLFARVQDARRSNRTVEAAAWLALAPKDAATLIDPDKWWSERRMIAREFLDRGAPDRAFAVCADAVTVSAPAQVDAAFHAGWIALRFLNDAAKAAPYFTAADKAAITPLAVSRANYWRGRAAEALDKSDEAHAFYAKAAGYPIAYYGQLAAKKLETPIAPRDAGAAAEGDSRAEATRAIEIYYDAGLDDFGNSLAYIAAQTWTDPSQIAALGRMLRAKGSATANVVYGKLATERGFPVDETAFPTFGLPSFAPLARSADTASVLAIARQESEFIWRAASGAGAKGLMQILPSTAQSTARRAGVPYDFGRLINDPAFNLQLGAAFLGQLQDDEGGSTEMVFAAYNAGAGRVAQWIAAYGDPRLGKVDLVDWVERIPYDETRDYVERVSENLGIYKARLAAPVRAAEAESGAIVKE